ncbi:hypothetical protein [Fretibacter rubidus]|uniref:hypothetical protein n=1 Tax=Fretibacter rubidus TaxID=570162 RepID=UPI00352A7812
MMPLDLWAFHPDFNPMTGTYNIAGRNSLMTNIMRGLFVAAAAVAGFFVLAFSAAFAFFVVAGIAIVGALVFAFFWTRAKLFGRPFGPKATFEAARRDMEAQMRAQTGQTAFRSADSDRDGPIIDAHKTPQGWSVDD